MLHVGTAIFVELEQLKAAAEEPPTPPNSPSSENAPGLFLAPSTLANAGVQTLHSASSALRRTVGEPMQAVASTVTSIMSSGLEETFTCQVCLCLERLDDAFKVNPCGHAFCMDCILGHISAQVTDGIVEIQCPHVADEGTHRCEVVLTDTDVRGILQNSPEMIRKYERFKAARQHPNMRECPQCEHAQIGDPEQPQMLCESCGVTFCFVHGNAHPPTESCEAYERRSTSAATRALVATTTKPCPQCGAPSYKYTGCNHMKCPQCQCDWCWLCGESISIDGSGIAPAHYDQRNPFSGCAGRQFERGRQREGTRGFWYGVLYRSPVVVPFYMFAGLVYALLTLVLLPCLTADAGFRTGWFRWSILTEIVTGCYGVIAAVVVAPVCAVIWILCMPFILLCHYYVNILECLAKTARLVLRGANRARRAPR